MVTVTSLSRFFRHKFTTSTVLRLSQSDPNVLIHNLSLAIGFRPRVSLSCWMMYVFWLPLSRMILTQCFSWGCTELGFDAKAMHVCNKIDVLLSTYMLMAELGCLRSCVDGWGTPATELPDPGVSLAKHKVEWCRWEQFEQPRLESQFFAMWERLRQMK